MEITPSSPEFRPSPSPSDLEATWQATLQLLRGRLSESGVRIWILPLKPLFLRDGCLILECPNEFSMNWNRERHGDVIAESASAVLGKITSLEWILKDGAKPSNASAPAKPSRPGAKKSSPANDDLNPYLAPIPETPMPAVSIPMKQPQLEQKNLRPAPVEEAEPAIESSLPTITLSNNPNRARMTAHLDPRYNFDNFVVGSSNQFAHASAFAVAERPGAQYNPLFLYSSPGLGKTHLLNAIGNHVRAKNPDMQVTYISAENFVNDMIEAIQRNKMAEFRSTYRQQFHLLLIDDIQFIAGRQRTEEEFFHTFNALHSNRRQIVLSSDRPPKEIDGLEERIRTRFEWGLVVDIHPPEIETRIAILKSKSEQDDIYISDEIATFLATHVKTNVRELEGLLIRLQAQASLTGMEISLEMAKQELKHALPEEGSHFTIDTIQQAVAKTFGLKTQDLKASTRARNISLPRQIAMYLIRRYTGLGFKEIGSYFGGKDHTTILHACQKIEFQIQRDPAIRQEVEKIQALL